MNTKRQSLEAAVTQAKEHLAFAQAALDQFDYAPENHVYPTLDDAYALEEVLRDRAYQDCEGAYNCGQPEYSQEFYVDAKLYEAKAKVEYNRHDKTYYYIDGFDFEIQEVK